MPGADAWDWPPSLHPVLRRVLARRPIASPEELTLSLKHLVPVGRFGALNRAVELLLEHRDDRIVIVGDFDADGLHVDDGWDDGQDSSLGVSAARKL